MPDYPGQGGALDPLGLLLHQANLEAMLREQVERPQRDLEAYYRTLQQTQNLDPQQREQIRGQAGRYLKPEAQQRASGAYRQRRVDEATDAAFQIEKQEQAELDHLYKMGERLQERTGPGFDLNGFLSAGMSRIQKKFNSNRTYLQRQYGDVMDDASVQDAMKGVHTGEEEMSLFEAAKKGAEKKYSPSAPMAGAPQAPAASPQGPPRGYMPPQVAPPMGPMAGGMTPAGPAAPAMPGPSPSPMAAPMAPQVPNPYGGMLTPQQRALLQRQQQMALLRQQALGQALTQTPVMGNQP